MRHVAPWRGALLLAGVTIVLATIATGPRHASTQAVQAEVAAGAVSEDAYPERRVRFPGGVTGLAGLTYTSERGYRPLELDLYLPRGATRTPHPFVVFVHGGGWMGGTRRTSGAFRDWPAVLASLAARGYVVASVDYRLAGEAAFPAALHDVQAALRWMRAHADTYGIDRSRAVIWGPSAGGHLAALAATSCGVDALREPEAADPGPGNAAVETSPPPPPRTESDCVQGAVVWYGVTDFTAIEGMDEASAFLGCDSPSCSPGELKRTASPVAYVDHQDPPFLIIHGTADRTVPVQQARTLHEALTSRAVPSELVLLPGIDHSFLGPTPAATRDASLYALTRTFAFVDQTIGDRRD